MEMLLWSPILAEPPMLFLKELDDGTYNIDDILQMNLLLKFKNKVREQE